MNGTTNSHVGSTRQTFVSSAADVLTAQPDLCGAARLAASSVEDTSMQAGEEGEVRLVR